MTKKVKEAYKYLSVRSRILLVITFSLLIIVGFATAANGFATGFSNQSPTADVNTSTPQISVHLNTSDGTYDTTQISMSIDGGTPFNPTVNGTNPDYDISYTPTTPMKDGNHTVLITVPNSANSITPYTTTWNFNIAVPPVISKPAPTYTVTSKTPVLSAYATDNTGLAKAEFKIDDPAQIPYTAKIYTYLGRISYQPTTPLSDGNHTVFLTVYDTNGNAASTQWTFVVDSNIGGDYPAMPVLNDATCWKCHPTLLSVTDGPTSMTAVIGGKHPLNQGCLSCHPSKISGSRKFQQCTNCHYDNPPAGTPLYLTTRHIGTAAFADIVNLRHPVSDIHLSSRTDCIKCHSRILTAEHYRPDRTDKDGNPINCDTCHTAAYLGEEVNTNGVLKLNQTMYPQITTSQVWTAPVGRTVSRIYIDHDLGTGVYMRVYALLNGKWGLVYGDITGTIAKWLDLPAPTTTLKVQVYPTNAYTNSYNWVMDVPKIKLTPNSDKYNKIQNAIVNKDTRCEACHEGVEMGHDAQHTFKDFDTINCNGCHTNIISLEHLNRKDANGNNYTCDTCHKSTLKEIKRTIAAGSLNCSGCHKTAHKINLVDKVPADIPLYDVFDQWSAPMEVSIFNGESPVGYDNGQMLLSNRKNITLSQVWDFYNTNLTTKDWALNSGAPSPEATLFSAEFAKDDRRVTVKCYNTSNSDGSGGTISSGYKTEIWYK